MAQNLVVNFIGQNKLSKTTAVISNDFKKLDRTVKTASASMSKALGAAGIGLGLASVTNLLKQSTKAASEDRKSQGLLAQALRNTVGATDQAIAGAEQYIKSTQLSTAVLDDELRPALATAVRATGSLAGGQKLLNTALDVSAGTGKDLGSVTNAISKAFNGNTASLRKLLPSIKDGADFMQQLDTQFKGAAKTAADLDPYKRLEVIFADIQETIGEALLPALEEFSNYLVTPEGQKNLRQVVDLFVIMGQTVANVTKFILDNIVVVKALTAAVVFAKVSWTLLSGAVNIYTAATGKAVIATKLLRTALITTGIGALVVGLGFLAEGWINATEEQEKYAVVTQGLPANFGQVPIGPGIGADGVSWIALGFASEQEYLASQEAVKNKVIAARDKALKAIADTGKRFRDNVGLKSGLFGKDENSVFNVDVVINKLKRVVDAARGFRGNLEKLKAKGAGQNVIDELIALGPAQGNIVAKGLLGSGSKFSEYLGLSGSLQATGESAQKLANDTGEKTYNVNINKANVSAEDIIKAIRTFEKKSGRKYFAF
jgi:hypothetical protein